MKVKLKLLEYLQTWTGNKPLVSPYACIDFDNLRRAFLVNQDNHKIISFAFDFSIKTMSPDYSKNNQVQGIHYFSTYGKIEPRNISEALSILAMYNSRCDNIYYDLCLDDEDNIAPESLRLFEFLLFKEDGYVRYDYDNQGYKPRIHPLNHFDINFSEPSHYKIGLARELDINEFMTFLDKQKVCAMLDLNPSRELKMKKSTEHKRKHKRKRKRKRKIHY